MNCGFENELRELCEKFESDYMYIIEKYDVDAMVAHTMFKYKFDNMEKKLRRNRDECIQKIANST